MSAPPTELLSQETARATVARPPDSQGTPQPRDLRLLSGVPPLPGWGPTSAPLFSCLGYLGEALDYPFLAALTGDAFRLRLTELRPHGPTDGEEIARTLTDLGRPPTSFTADDRDGIAAAIAETVAAGVPAIAWAPSTDAERWFGVVIGCDPGVEHVCLRTLGDESDAYRTEPFDCVATAREAGEPALYLIGPKAGDPSLDELAWSALTRAVALGRERVETSAEKYPFVQFGVRGYEAWANCLEHKAAGDRSPLVEADCVHAVRMHLAVTVDMKEQAEAFLLSVAADAPGAAASHLQTAAELFHEIWDVLAGIHPHLASFARCRLALSDKDRTEELASMLRRTAFLEDLAIDAIAKALQARR